MYKYIFITVFATLLSVVQAQEFLTLEQCRSKAINHNQDLKSAQADLAINIATLKMSKRAMLPQFDLSATYTYMNDPQVMDVPSWELPTVDGAPSGVKFTGLYKELTFNNMYDGGIDFSLPLYLGGKLRNYIKMSSIGVDISEKNVDNTRENLILEIDQKYWNLVSLKENLLVIQKSVKLLEDVVQETSNMYHAGILTKNEVLKTQVELNNTKLAMIQMKDNIQLAKMALNQSMGNGILDEIAIADSVIIPDQKPVSVDEIETIASNRKELKIMEGQVGISTADINIARSDYMPQLVSFANYGFQNPTHKAEDKTEFTWVAGLSFSMPVFHWGEKNLALEKKKLVNQKARLNYDKAKEGIILQIQQSAFNLNESLVKISFTKASLNQAEENLKLEMNRLTQGIVTTTNVLDAQVQWQKANSDFISAKVNYKINKSNYLKTIGQLEI
ncbi:TolC family protein [Plebeiibacterium marinum]|uniref:TolC family protein n=1 Tax=Plebeiibacterium marinum TaxID=2992111 RepID=A0AAE3MCN0_9BACT|nr:TolC family protein [Plebeiobacterium marinum]MCW3805311.1 TolC family protein [Plebeiobacterium marinum]